jgi:hypothetical protein
MVTENTRHAKLDITHQNFKLDIIYEDWYITA